MEPISGSIAAASATLAKLLQFRDKVKDGALHREISDLLNQFQEDFSAVKKAIDDKPLLRRDRMKHKNEALWENDKPYCFWCAYGGKLGQDIRLVPLDYPPIGGGVDSSCNVCGKRANVNNVLPSAPFCA